MKKSKSNRHSLESMAPIFPLMVEHAPVGILLLDAQGQIIHVNPKAQDILGYGKEELLGHLVEILLPERIRKRHIGLRSDFMDHPQARPMGTGRHLYARHKSGREIPVEIGLVPIKTAEGMAVLASIVDITAQKEATKTMKQLAAVVEGAVDAIISLGRDGEILTWNQGAEKLYGYPAGEMIGKNVSLLCPRDRMEEFRALRKMIQRGQIVQQVETVRLRKGGHPVSILLSISPLFSEEDELMGASTISHDITEKRRLEQDLLHSVETEQKRIGQDLHDALGQQLLAISFLCNVLKKKLAAQSSPEASEAGHIEELLNQAKLSLRKLTRGLYAADLEAQGLGSSLKLLIEHVHEASAIPCHFEGDANLKLSDRIQSENLFRLAQEAINNALKHSFAKDITVSLHKKGDQVTLSVKDSGVGIPELSLRTSGLGLRTMQYRASVMGGSLDVRRHPSGGTIVTCSVSVA